MDKVASTPLNENNVNSGDKNEEVSNSYALQSPSANRLTSFIADSELSSKLLDSVGAESALSNDDATNDGESPRSPRGKWTNEEDELLRQAVQQHEGRNWKKISECLVGRTDVQCLHRWQKVLRPGLIKGPWTKEVLIYILQYNKHSINFNINIVGR